MISYLNTDSLEQVCNLLDEKGFRVFVLNGDKVFDAKSFFATIRLVLPLDPPLSGRVNWNAFSDSLWYGIDALAEKKVAVIWKNAENMMNNDYSNFQIAVECFEEVALTTAKEESGVDEPIKLRVFMFGTSDKFISLDLKALE